MKTANVIRLGLGAAIAIGLLVDHPATSEAVARDAAVEAVSDAIASDAAAEAAIAREETCSERARAERIRSEADRPIRRL